MCYDTGNKWGHRNSKKRFQEKFEIHKRKKFNRATKNHWFKRKSTGKTKPVTRDDDDVADDNDDDDDDYDDDDNDDNDYDDIIIYLIFFSQAVQKEKRYPLHNIKSRILIFVNPPQKDIYT